MTIRDFFKQTAVKATTYLLGLFGVYILGVLTLRAKTVEQTNRNTEDIKNLTEQVYLLIKNKEDYDILLIRIDTLGKEINQTKQTLIETNDKLEYNNKAIEELSEKVDYQDYNNQDWFKKIFEKIN